MKIVLIGDSLCKDLGSRRPEWVCQAYGGAKTKEWLEKYPDPITADIVVISIGINDLTRVYRRWNTKEMMRKIRNNITAGKVFWLVAVGGETLIPEIANEFGDKLINCIAYQMEGTGLYLTYEGTIAVAEEIEKHMV
jgi:lysophospholipase L1-like esterase